MLGIQLNTLSQPELKRLLELSRKRGQPALVKQLEAELAGRSGRARRTLEPAPMAAAMRSPAAAPAPRRRNYAPAAMVAGLAAFVGAAAAWGVSVQPVQAPAQMQPVSMTSATPAPRVAVALSTQLPEEAPQQPLAEPAAPAVDEVDHPATLASHDRNPCYALATARERLVCGYPSLAIQDRRLKAVLEHARTAGVDTKALETTQAAWNSGSANIHDRQVLAERYAQRIAEVQAEIR